MFGAGPIPVLYWELYVSCRLLDRRLAGGWPGKDLRADLLMVRGHVRLREVLIEGVGHLLRATPLRTAQVTTEGGVLERVDRLEADAVLGVPSGPRDRGNDFGMVKGAFHHRSPAANRAVRALNLQLLLALRIVPERVHLRQIAVLGAAAGGLEAGFDMGEAAGELGVGPPQRRLGADIHVPREVGHHEEKVAEFLLDMV